MTTHHTKEEAVERLEHVEKGFGEERSLSTSSTEFDPKESASIRHRIDWRLIPALGAMYGISLMDRKNVSNAAIAGMLKDLKMSKGYGYNLVNMCFFITYILLQPFMIVLCRKIGPRFFLPGICILWGCVIVGFGFAQNWPTLIPLRLLLGALESGYFPGCLYLLSCWYTKFEVARRYSLFYFIGSIASAMSGILAYGLQQMDGASGIRGWRWIFIMEGVITCAVAIFAISFIIKFPDEEKAKPSWGFLKPNELDHVIERLNADRGDVEPEAFTWKKFLEPATEWYIYGFPMILLFVTSIAYGFAFFLPIILSTNLGFSMAMSQCLGAPPYAFSGIIMYGAAWFSDKYKTRGPVLCALCMVSLVGLPIMAFVNNPWGQYVGVFITVSGTNSAIPAVMAYQANNIRGQWRRAYCSASLTAIGGIGGITGALIFRTEDAPKYVPGIAACMTCNALTIITVGILTIYFRRCNRQADRGERILLGDPNFRFTI
ncbi:MFS general substrate transporter [Aaosphaeria arxii CBS 175.79]|uniref:MFS general substrate transporter n=1 Tax=Aaosphaeria arxii CBS 175.79 TaxID=1450172 RepID=A0A6A5XX01_9PLEO|nr:MFS general substrate transporter [Aaosphaeria arxii CBS 175.79]KAF2017231.1 MFS general substrate transporter [Aaosphaeria arxii CBS 175.79]